MRLGIYGASLDPLTNGHMHVIEAGAQMFDHLVVGIAVNPAKKYMYPVEKRVDITRQSLSHLDNVKVEVLGNEFLVNFALRIASEHMLLKGVWLLRGIRNATDLEYETTMQSVNRDIAPRIDTAFVVCPPELAKVSSSMVKGLVGPNGWENLVRKYVPGPVADALISSVKKT